MADPTFKEILDADLGVFFNTSEFAVAGVYTPKDGDPSDPIPVLVEYGVGVPEDGVEGHVWVWHLGCIRDLRAGFDGGRTREVAMVSLKKSDVSKPGYRDTIEIDGVVWTVSDIFDR